MQLTSSEIVANSVSVTQLSSGALSGKTMSGTVTFSGDVNLRNNG